VRERALLDHASASSRVQSGWDFHTDLRTAQRLGDVRQRLEPVSSSRAAKHNDE